MTPLNGADAPHQPILYEIMTRSIHIQAPAKINAALSVGPPAEDGMHPICSWMLTIDLHDEMTLTALEPDRLSRYAIMWHEDALQRREIDWSLTSDLAVRAHQSIEKHVGRPLPVQMKLEKRIPLGGGLGGGSSDAAAMLRGINTLFDLSLTDDVLESLGSKLGSDIPFLVRGGSAIVEGTGERVEHLPMTPDVHAVLVLPEMGCETGAVYRKLDEMDPTTVDPAAVRSLAESGFDGDRLFNDLADPALKVAPGLGNIREQLAGIAGLPVHVSGSGSTLFIACADVAAATALAAEIQSTTGLSTIPVSAIDHGAGILGDPS
ncbi:MAG: 4-(cytidine 5'-diphospho)-2-C-methyl-D-erythritol kinase [Phycisphaerae bacterium]|nr:4-(cytidine 5'-diphospho)-2-C-methyl-D-erythritol kinase [Phycisphaerae bacterium]